MSKSKRDKKISQDQLLIIIGVIFLITVVAVVIYTLTFLSHVVTLIFLTDTDSADNSIKFNLERFDELDLTIPGTSSASVNTDGTVNTGTSTEQAE